jgi:hypothetical protein
MKHEEDASDCKNDEEEAGDSSQAKRIREAEAVTLYLGWEDMEEKVVIDQQGTLQVGIRNSGSENRAPHRRMRNALQDSSLHPCSSL